jgi:membrane protease YdiL (CAAX protease family)
MDNVRRARRGLLIFMLALVASTFGMIYLDRFLPKVSRATIAFAFLITTILSYSPAIAALIARVSLREGIKDVSFRLRGEWVSKAILIAWLWPVVSGFLTYGIAWTAGFTRFQWTSLGYPFGSWGPENLVGISILDLPVSQQFSIRLASCLLFAPIACLQSFGEELGWRGYMLTRLFDAKIPVPVFWNGLIWGLWHIPFVLLLTTNRNLPERRSVSLFFFVISSIALSYLLGYLRLRSGSIWPAVLAHASGNTVLTMAFTGFTNGTVFWKGELDLLTVGIWVVVLMLARRPWPLRYWPSPKQ